MESFFPPWWCSVSISQLLSWYWNSLKKFNNSMSCGKNGAAYANHHSVMVPTIIIYYKVGTTAWNKKFTQHLYGWKWETDPRTLDLTLSLQPLCHSNPLEVVGINNFQDMLHASCCQHKSTRRTHLACVFPHTCLRARERRRLVQTVPNTDDKAANVNDRDASALSFGHIACPYLYRRWHHLLIPQIALTA